MKNIKTIYKLFLLLAVVFVVSCDDSDDMNDVVSQIDNGLTTQNSVFFAAEEASPNYIGELNENFELIVSTLMEVGSDTSVDFSVLKNGSPAVLGADYNTSAVVISSGGQTNTGLISFLTVGDYEVKIENSDNINLTTSSAQLAYKILTPIVDDVFNFTFVWDDNFYDYDLYLVKGNQDFNGEVYGYSGGVSNSETIEESLKWGSSSFYILDYYGDNASTPGVLTVTKNDVEIEGSPFNVIMDMSKWVMDINVLPDANGDPVYTYTLL